MPSIPHFKISIKMNNPNNMYCTVYQSTVNKVAPIPKKDRVVGVPIKKGQGSPVVGDLSSTHALPVLGRIMLDSYIIRGSLDREAFSACRDSSAQAKDPLLYFQLSIFNRK
jgi:hypothetical protein